LGSSKSIYVADQDGSLVRKLEKPTSEISTSENLLFTSLDEESVYWLTSDCPDLSCDVRFFKTNLDDSDQNEVWTEIDTDLMASFWLFLHRNYITFVSNNRSSYYMTLNGENISEPYQGF